MPSRAGATKNPSSRAFVLIGIGVAALGHFEWIGTLIAISIYGAGLGFLSPATNLWIGEAAKTGRAGALNLINFSWTAGAMLCPSWSRSPPATNT